MSKTLHVEGFEKAPLPSAEQSQASMLQASSLARRALALSPRMLSSSISSKPRHLVSRRHRPQKVPPPSEEPLTREYCPSPVTFSMLTPLPIFTSR